MQKKCKHSLAGLILILVLSASQAMAGGNLINVASNAGVGVVEIDDTDGQCSLREAIENANDEIDGQPNTDCEAGEPNQSDTDTVILPSGSTFTIEDIDNNSNGNNGLPVITSTITIEANGSTIRRDPGDSDSFRILAIDGDVDNVNLTLNETTISGGLANVGGAGNNGGCIFNNGGILTIVNSTISGNTATDGGGILTFNGSSNIQNTIVSGNNASNSGDNCANLGTGTTTDNGNNLSNDNSCGFGPNMNINLGPLAFNGGPTQTHALLAGSSAIDGVPNGECVDQNSNPINIDQRGFQRPVDGDNVAGALCDIGAFEAQPTAKAIITKITNPAGGTDFNFEVLRMGDSTIVLTTFTLDDAEMDMTMIPTGDIQIREIIPANVIDLEINCDASLVGSTPAIDNEAGTVDVTIMSSAEMLDCVFNNTLQTGGGSTGGGGMDEDIDIIPGDNGEFAEISISSGIPGGGSIFIDLPDEVLALAASLVPNIASCEILGSQTANIEDADVVCDIEDFPFEIDVILNLCRQGNVSGVANAVVEVISDDRPEESAEETIEILLNDLELCQVSGDGDGDGDSEPGGDGDTGGDGDGAGSGCSVAPVNTTSTSSIFVTLLSAVAGIAGVFFRRRK